MRVSAAGNFHLAKHLERVSRNFLRTLRIAALFTPAVKSTCIIFLGHNAEILRENCMPSLAFCAPSRGTIADNMYFELFYF
jgi:hypothetical protein